MFGQTAPAQIELGAKVALEDQRRSGGKLSSRLTLGNHGECAADAVGGDVRRPRSRLRARSR